ncbi:MAG: hypothetical protein K0S56_2379 [Microvirga sp.]|nr:hypothetical protein [Microvirga sp.]
MSDSKRHHIGVCQSGVTYTEAFDLIRSLVEVIRLVPENGELKVELRGELAGILACGDLKPPRFVKPDKKQSCV